MPVLVFDRPLNLHGQVSRARLVMNCEVSLRKIQAALGGPKEIVDVIPLDRTTYWF